MAVTRMTNWCVMRLSASSKSILLFVGAALLSGCVALNERQAESGHQLETLEDEVRRLRYKLQSSREELSILTKAFSGATPTDLLSRAAAARESVYPTADRERDLKYIKRSLEREVAATDAEIRVMTFPLRTAHAAEPAAHGDLVTGPEPIVPEMAISREQAIALAKQEISKRTGSGDIEVTSAECKNDRWIVVIWALPKTPGGYGILEVSQDGKVKTLRGGRGSR